MTESQIDLKELGRVLLKRAWIIILCAVLAGALALAYTVNFVTPVYNASVSLYVNNNNKTTAEGGVSSSDLAVAIRLVNTYVEIIRSDAVLDKVAQELGSGVSAAQLRGMVSTSVVEDTEIFDVVVSSTDPQRAADIANAIAKVAPKTISDIINGSNAKIIDYAKVPSTFSSPSYPRNTLLGALAGAFLAIVVIFVTMYFDTRIKDEETLKRICGCAILGVIPDFTEAANTSSKLRKERR